MMAGNPNWWSMNNGMHPQSPANPSPVDHHHLHPNGQDLPVRSWSQLLMGGLANINEEEAFGANLFQQQKKLENWEDQVLDLNPIISSNFTKGLVNPTMDHVKQEAYKSQFYGQSLDDNEFIHHTNVKLSNSWTSHHHQAMPVSSPTSCITTLSNNILNFSGEKSKNQQHNQDHSSECNSTGTGGASKKARVTQSSSVQPALKVRKEKLGDRITSLHQLVSPFGKTDTASVLSEAIGYIRFLQAQIEALSTPYMRNASGSTTPKQHQLSVQERNCLFPDEPSQGDQEGRLGHKDLRSRGLCLVPISCTQHVGAENSATDYWAPAAFGGNF
ncbi:hypothetical protein CASFOL_024896 [Castilleja foliolosa]|uniref:BHLH domain-containing protein n=1 Tax=Castilleja foliolosa TaxID=1961234 RepID=A0ABD3CR19_9LAMI